MGNCSKVIDSCSSNQKEPQFRRFVLYKRIRPWEQYVKIQNVTRGTLAEVSNILKAIMTALYSLCKSAWKRRRLYQNEKQKGKAIQKNGIWYCYTHQEDTQRPTEDRVAWLHLAWSRRIKTIRGFWEPWGVSKPSRAAGPRGTQNIYKGGLSKNVQKCFTKNFLFYVWWCVWLYNTTCSFTYIVPTFIHLDHSWANFLTNRPHRGF